MEVKHDTATETSTSGETGSSITPQPRQNTAYDITSIKDNCKTSLDLFAGVLTGDVASCPFPPYYHKLWQLFTDPNTRDRKDKVFRFALGLPRGHAKTMFIKLLACWMILHHKAKFILLVCSTESLAYNMMDDIDYMLSSPQVTSIWGDWKRCLERDTKGLKRGIFQEHSIVIAALGSGSSTRGINVLLERPDFILLDDIQTKECAKSVSENAALLEWLVGTLLKCRDMDWATIIYVGNMYNVDCILHKLKLSPDWQSFITGAILADWSLLWPAKFTLAQLLAEYMHDCGLGQADVWFSEVLNMPIGGALSLFPDGKLPSTSIQGCELPIGSFLIVDPSGYRKDSDDTALVTYHIHAPIHYQLRNVVASVMTPGECIANIDALVREYKCTHVFIETVAYQQSLKWHVEQHFAKASNVKVCELKPKRRNKTARIRSWIKELIGGSMSIHQSELPTIMYQGLAFKVERTDNKDDILDAGAYALDVREDYQHELIGNYGDTPMTSAIGVLANNSFLDGDSDG